MAKVFHKLTIVSPIGKVHEALTDIEKLKSWWMKESKGSSNEEGGEIEFGNKEMWYHKMNVSTLKGDNIVWDVVECDGKMPGVETWMNTKISFELEEKQLERLEGKTVTIVLFKHDGFDDSFAETKQFAEINWHWGYLLLSLKNVCEGKEGMAM
jgi:uncharacterized protein YndB with AHSA1/START domain